MHTAPPLILRPGDRSRLSSLAADRSRRALAQRAQIVLLAAEGRPNNAIADSLRCSRPTVRAWRRRYQHDGIAGLRDLDRPGRPTVVRDSEVLAATMLPPPRPTRGAWSARALAAELNISPHTVARVWRKWGVDGRLDTVPLQPALPPHVGPIVGVYLGPPELCLAVLGATDGRSAATTRSHDGSPPAGAGGPADHAGSDQRPAYQAILRALPSADSQVGDDCLAFHHHAEFLSFVEDLYARHGDDPIHLIQCDTALESAPAGVAATTHTTPTGVSWFDAVDLVAGLAASRGAGPAGFADGAVLSDRLRGASDSQTIRYRPFRWIA